MMTSLAELTYTFRWLERCRIADWLSSQEFCRFRNNLQTHLTTKGLVVHTSEPTPMIETAAYQCKHCNRLTNIVQRGQFLLAPAKCGGCGELGPFRLCMEVSEYVQSQMILLQIEAFSSLDVSGLLFCRLTVGRVDSVQVGDRIVVTGLVRAVVPSHVTYGKQLTCELELTADTVKVLPKETPK
jgi:DNA replicative helicase MCM subunit Mcm2 (Cdc46/Mcm family)